MAILQAPKLPRDVELLNPDPPVGSGTLLIHPDVSPPLNTFNSQSSSNGKNLPFFSMRFNGGLCAFALFAPRSKCKLHLGFPALRKYPDFFLYLLLSLPLNLNWNSQDTGEWVSLGFFIPCLQPLLNEE